MGNSPHANGAAIDVVEDPRDKKPSTICRNCDRDVVHHMAEGKCPFEASSFDPWLLGELVDSTMRAMYGKTGREAKFTGTTNAQITGL